MKIVLQVYVVPETMKKVLIPILEDGKEWLDGQKNGAQVMADVKKPRNLEHHRKFYALMHQIYGVLSEKQLRFWPSFDVFMQDLKIGCGHYETRIGFDRQPYAVAKSIDFSSMDQSEFDDFYKKVEKLVFEKVLPFSNASKETQDEIAERF